MLTDYKIILWPIWTPTQYRFSGVIMINEDDDQKNAPPPINRFSGTISFSRRKMQSRNLEQVRKMSTDKPPKRPKKNPSKESRLKGMLKKRRGWKWSDGYYSYSFQFWVLLLCGIFIKMLFDMWEFSWFVKRWYENCEQGTSWNFIRYFERYLGIVPTGFWSWSRFRI